MTTRPNHALQRTRRERRGCNRSVPCAGVAELGSLGRSHAWQIHHQFRSETMCEFAPHLLPSLMAWPGWLAQSTVGRHHR